MGNPSDLVSLTGEIHQPRHEDREPGRCSMDRAALDTESGTGWEVELTDPQCDMGSGGERRREFNGDAQRGDLVRHVGIQGN